MNTQDNKKRSRNIILRTLTKSATGISLKTACLLTLALLFLPILSSLNAQNDSLFENTEPGSIELTERQSELLDLVDSRPFTKEVQLVNLRFSEAIKHRDSFSLNLPGDRMLYVHKRTVYESERGPYTWSGIPDEGYATVLLTVNDGNITGKIQSLDFHYNITPLGNGLHALYEIDQSKAPPDHPDVDMEEFYGRKIGGEGFQESANQTAAKQELFNGENYQTSSSTTSAIDLLVLYTDAVKNSVINIQDEIASAVSGLNESISNSSINATVSIAHTYEVNYQESGFLDTDLARLQDPDSGYMDGIHSLRESVGANLVVLLVAPPGNACGFAFQNADYENGFSIVRFDCIAPFNTFAHEIGHNIGAHHSRTCNFDHDSGPTWNTDFQYGHGYNVPELSNSTIMACGYSRINYWSNPFVDLGMGGPIPKINLNNLNTNLSSTPSIPYMFVLVF